MRRLGLVWRVALIVVAALFILQLVIAGVFLHERSRITQVGLRLPLSDQVAALATLLDHAAPDQQSLLLRAVNGAGLHAEVRHDRPADIDTGREMERVESALRKYLAAPADRFIAARLIGGPSTAAIVFPRLRGYLDSRAEIVVSLASGDYLVVESADQLVPRLFRLPTGFSAGIIGFLVAAGSSPAPIPQAPPPAPPAPAGRPFLPR